MPENENPSDAPKPKAPELLTNDQVNALLAKQKREMAEKFADYDDLRAKASKLDEIEQASKSELQKLLDENTTLKTRVEFFEREKQVAAWAAEITKDSGIPPEALRGNTKEELEQHFNVLSALVPKQQQKRHVVPPGTPSGEQTGSRAAAALRQMRGTE